MGQPGDRDLVYLPNDGTTSVGIDNIAKMAGYQHQSNEVQELYKAIIAAKKEFGKVVCNAGGQEGNQKYRYAPLENYHDAMDGPLLEHDLFINHQLLPLSVKGQIYTLMITQLNHVSGQFIASFLLIPGMMDSKNKKTYGGLITYARRYQVGPILGVPSVGEDTENDSQMPPSREGELPIHTALRETAKAYRLDPDYLRNLLQQHNCSKIRELSSGQCSAIINTLTVNKAA